MLSRSILFMAKKSPAPKAIAVDAERFTSTAYKAGKTKSAVLFKKPFLDTGMIDDIIGSKAQKASKDGAAPTTAKSRRKSPFALVNETEKVQFAELVSKNMKALSRPGAADTAAAQLSSAAVTNKGVPATSKKKDDLILERHVKRISKRRRTSSSFFTRKALIERDGSFTVAEVPQKNAPCSKKDALNPVNISGSFFTSYERKQYSRLKSATMLLRNPRKLKLQNQRKSLYRFWDRVMDGVVPAKQ